MLRRHRPLMRVAAVAAVAAAGEPAATHAHAHGRADEALLSTDVRAVFASALHAVLVGDVAALERSFTEDVTVWSPNVRACSLLELAEELAENDEALTHVELSIDALDVADGKVIAEWRVRTTHSGPLLVGDDLLIEPTGRRVDVAGASFAEFRGDRIRALRTYFDDAAIIEQLMVR